MIPQANQIYRHFKGNLYRVITVAEHTENKEQLVIYQALYGEYKVYARPLSMFVEDVDKEKYPNVTQRKRFEPVDQLVETVAFSTSPETVMTEEKTKQQTETVMTEEKTKQQTEAVTAGENAGDLFEAEENVTIDPLLEQYLDTDSYREKLNILHGLHHRITENMLITMAVVIDFELPEGDIQTKYDALNDCLLTKEKYECNRIL